METLKGNQMKMVNGHESEASRKDFATGLDLATIEYGRRPCW